KKCSDYRAERIKEYLNMLHTVVTDKVQQFKEDLVANKSTLEHYVSLLPDASELKNNLQKFVEEGVQAKEQLKKYLTDYFVPGAIDVNIMTKVDKENYKGDQQLPVMFNDAHASLRGFAESNLNAAVVLSAGM